MTYGRTDGRTDLLIHRSDMGVCKDTCVSKKNNSGATIFLITDFKKIFSGLWTKCVKHFGGNVSHFNRRRWSEQNLLRLFFKVFTPPEKFFKQSADFSVRWREANEKDAKNPKARWSSWVDLQNNLVLWQISTHTNQCGSVEQITERGGTPFPP